MAPKPCRWVGSRDDPRSQAAGTTVLRPCAQCRAPEATVCTPVAERAVDRSGRPCSTRVIHGNSLPAPRPQFPHL